MYFNFMIVIKKMEEKRLNALYSEKINKNILNGFVR